jgi:hypothetical protein
VVRRLTTRIHQPPWRTRWWRSRSAACAATAAVPAMTGPTTTHAMHQIGGRHAGPRQPTHSWSPEPRLAMPERTRQVSCTSGATGPLEVGAHGSQVTGSGLARFDHDLPTRPADLRTALTRGAAPEPCPGWLGLLRTRSRPGSAPP